MTDEAVMEALGDAYSRRILSACVRTPRAVKGLAHEAALPLPTAYRRVRALQDAGLLFIERSALTEDGKRYDLYRSRIRFARMELDHGGTVVTWELNAPVEERLASMWDELRFQAGGRK